MYCRHIAINFNLYEPLGKGKTRKVVPVLNKLSTTP
jgi:hypothetical protein